jgi:hypothetical protein
MAKIIKHYLFFLLNVAKLRIYLVWVAFGLGEGLQKKNGCATATLVSGSAFLPISTLDLILSTLC